MNASKQRFGADDLDGVLQGLNEVVVAKGKKVQRFDLRDEELDREALHAALLGPTGNLRAPAIRSGKRLLVGFHPEAYGEQFG